METGSKGKQVEEIPSEEMSKMLKDVNFPAKKNDIIEQARKSGAMTDVLLQKLGMLEDKEYSSTDEVIKELERR